MPNFEVIVDDTVFDHKMKRTSILIQIRNRMDFGCSISRIKLLVNDELYKAYTFDCNNYGVKDEYSKREMQDIYLRQFESITLEPYFNLYSEDVEATLIIETPIGDKKVSLNM